MRNAVLIYENVLNFPISNSSSIPCDSSYSCLVDDIPTGSKSILVNIPVNVHRHSSGVNIPNNYSGQISGEHVTVSSPMTRPGENVLMTTQDEPIASEHHTLNSSNEPDLASINVEDVEHDHMTTSPGRHIPLTTSPGEFVPISSPDKYLPMNISPSQLVPMSSAGDLCSLDQHDTTLGDRVNLTSHGVHAPITTQDDPFTRTEEQTSLNDPGVHDPITGQQDPSTAGDNIQLANTDLIGITSPFLTNARKSGKVVTSPVVITDANSDNNNSNKSMCVYCHKLIKTGNLINHMKNVHKKTTKNTAKISSEQSEVKNKSFSCDFCDYKTTKEINSMD